MWGGGGGGQKYEIYAAGFGSHLFAVRNEVVKVMFLHLSVILFMGRGDLPKYMLGYPLGADTPQQIATAADGMHPNLIHSCL